MQLHCVCFRRRVPSSRPVFFIYVKKVTHARYKVPCFFSPLHHSRTTFSLVPCLLPSLVLLRAYWHRFDKQHTLHLFAPHPRTCLLLSPWHVQTHALHGDLLAFPFPLYEAWHIFCLPCYLLVCLSITACVRGILCKFSKKSHCKCIVWMFIHNS